MQGDDAMRCQVVSGGGVFVWVFWPGLIFTHGQIFRYCYVWSTGTVHIGTLRNGCTDKQSCKTLGHRTRMSGRHNEITALTLLPWGHPRNLSISQSTHLVRRLRRQVPLHAAAWFVEGLQGSGPLPCFSHQQGSGPPPSI